MLFFYVQSNLNGFVLDMQGGSTQDRTPKRIVAFPKSRQTDSQLWAFTEDGFIVSKLNGFVLDILGRDVTSQAPARLPAPIISFHRKPDDFARSNLNQKWILGAGGLIISQAFAFASGDHIVLDIQGASEAPGTPIIAFPKNGDNGTPNQQWTLTW